MTHGIEFCTIDGCGNKESARGWCPKHYWRWSKYGDPEAAVHTHSPPGQQPPCLVESCGNTAHAQGYCPKHYQRWRMSGDPLGSAPPKAPEYRPCSHCGAVFTWRGTRALYCSDACREAVKASTRKQKQPPRFCVQCGAQFPTSKGGANTCSADCRKARNAVLRAEFVPSRQCSDCDRPIDRSGSNGRCGSCQQRVVRAAFIAECNPCQVEGCTRLRRMPGSEFCDMHRSRVRRFGSPGEPEPAYIRGAGSIDGNGYRIVSVPDGRRGPEHRFVMEDQIGRYLWPDENVHHKNGQRADNRIENLELWSTFQPKGQRFEDKLEYAREILARYDGLTIPSNR